MRDALYLVGQYSVGVLVGIFFVLSVLFFLSHNYAKGVYWLGAAIVNVGVLLMGG